MTRSGGDGKFFYQQPRSGRRFFSAFPPCGGLLLTKKMAALSLSFSPPSVLLHFRFRSRDRDARCSAAYRAPACFFAPFLSPWQTISPLFTSLRGGEGGGGDGFFREGRKGGEGKVEVPARFARHPSFVPDEKIRMKHRASASFMRAWRKHQTGSRPDFPRDNVACVGSNPPRGTILELKFR